jgi:hypothetical protein
VVLPKRSASTWPCHDGGLFALVPRRPLGTDELPEKPVWLAAGPLSADLVGENLRSVIFDDEEVIRAISYVVRDKDWGT